jgi:hypothetical protein
LSCDGDTCGAKGTSLVQDVSQALKNVKVEGYDSRFFNAVFFGTVSHYLNFVIAFDVFNVALKLYGFFVFCFFDDNDIFYTATKVQQTQSPHNNSPLQIIQHQKIKNQA